VLGNGRDNYELTIDGKDEERRAWLSLNLKDAFDTPERVAVEALWYQPALRTLGAMDVRVKLADRYIDGVDWESSGPLLSPPEGTFVDDRDKLLQLMSIKNQRLLGTDELLFVLDALGASREPFFAVLVRNLSDVKVVSKPYARRAHGTKHIYELTFDELDGTDLPRLDLFCGKLLDVLIAWSVEEVIELVVRVRNLEKELRYA
jgi:type VI secretion system protein ImpG